MALKRGYPVDIPSPADKIKRVFETPVIVRPHRTDPAPPGTRLRLIQSAGEVFAEKGFRAAQVRDICRRADANVAAVNYHFTNKAGLYEAVLRHAHRSATEKYPLAGAVENLANPRERLGTLIEAFLRRLLEGGWPSWHGKLMMQEFADPTPALGQICRDYFRPTLEVFKTTLAPLVADPKTLNRTTLSVLGMCVFYRLADNPLRIMKHSPPGTPQGIRDLARHITEFTLGGLDRMRAAGAKPSTPASRAPRTPR
jgi:AcrR family transcriptional regulator